MGFGGLDITSGGIVQIQSKLPSTWKSITIESGGINKKTYIVK